MSAAELMLAFLSGIGMGIALDRWLLPPLVDTWIAVTCALRAEDIEAA